MIDLPFFDRYGLPLLAGLFLVLFLLESKFALRKRVQSRWKRIWVNTVLSLPALALNRLLLIPAMVWLAAENQNWQVGVGFMLPGPDWITAVLLFLLLDYSNYGWHVLLHKWPFLWRFHLVHHTDLDLDITTAFRFHFGEMLGSLLYRGAVVLLLGASPLLVLVYEITFEAATQFHHSNTKLPLQLEKILNLIMVTPRLHGIHHSERQEETDSNYSVIFSFWDRIHRTSRLNVPQQAIVTGVAGYSHVKDFGILKLLKLPFTSVPNRNGKKHGEKKNG